MSFAAVIKVGGSLSRGNGLPALCEEIGRLGKRYALLIVPGGGDFAEQVREADRRFRLDASASHSMALLAMAIAVTGVLGAWYFFGNGARRAARVVQSFAGVHRWLSGKYFVDELYERLIGRPLVWVSDRVFLRLGDRKLLDGTLDGLAALGQRGAALLGRVQTGQLQWYAALVLIGTVGALLWSWRHV